jgi:hypothetical protein
MVAKIEVVSVPVVTTTGRFSISALAPGKSLTTDCNYRKLEAFARKRCRKIKSVFVFCDFENAVLNKVPAVNAYQMTRDYDRNEFRVA